MKHYLTALKVCMYRLSASLSFDGVKSSSESMETLQRYSLSNLLQEFLKRWCCVFVSEELFFFGLKSVNEKYELYVARRSARVCKSFLLTFYG